MKTSLFLLALMGIAPLASADLTIVQSVESSAGTYKVTIKIKGERVRIQANPKSSMIVDTKTGEVITLVPEQKAMEHLSAEKARALGNKFRTLLKDTNTSLEIAPPKPTGRKDKINGREAEEYIAETPKYRATYWVAQSYPDYQAILRQMKPLQSSAIQAVRQATPEYYDFPGLPIRTVIKLEGQEETTTTITSISQDPLPESEFVAPADYAEVHWPELELQPAPPLAPQAPEKPDDK